MRRHHAARPRCRGRVGSVDLVASAQRVNRRSRCAQHDRSSAGEGICSAGSRTVLVPALCVYAYRMKNAAIIYNKYIFAEK